MLLGKRAGSKNYFLKKSRRSGVKYNFRFYLLLVAMLIAVSVESLAQAGRKSAPQGDKKSASEVNRKSAPPEPSSPFPRIAYDERSWKPFESSDGGFVIAFPGKPGFQTHTGQSAAGPLAYQTHGLDIGVAFFIVSYTDIPVSLPLNEKELINRALDAGRDRALAGAGGKLITESPLTLDGYPGRYLFYSDANSLTHSHNYLVGKRLYQLLVISDDYRTGPAEDQKFFKDIVNRFFTSFKLTRKTY
jgi:hypothetical protein